MQNKNEVRFIVTAKKNVYVCRIADYNDMIKEIIRQKYELNYACENIYLYGKHGQYRYFPRYANITPDNLPHHNEIAAIVIEKKENDSYIFWEYKPNTVKIISDFDECGLYNRFRFDVDCKSQAQEERTVHFESLVLGEVINQVDVADIYGSYAYDKYHQPGSQDFTLQELCAWSRKIEQRVNAV